ncbi:MAG: DUF5522 domain-containing protein [Chitinophagaceae bacterium]
MKKPLFDDEEQFAINEEGKIVFSATYLLQRGYCCGNGCLHCPYDYKNVINLEKKKLLLEKRKQKKDD